MDNKSRILLVSFVTLVFSAVGFAFYKYYVLSDYYIVAETECDPEAEKCFVYECDPESDTECPEAVEERASYYKLIKKKAYDMPLCAGDEEACSTLACGENEDCEEIVCDESTKSEEDTCSDPREFQMNRGAAEEITEK